MTSVRSLAPRSQQEVRPDEGAGTQQPVSPPPPLLLPALLVSLGGGMAGIALLGPAGAGLLRYRTSATTLNQLIGTDTAALLVVGPMCLVAALLVFRQRPAGAPLATGVGAFAAYTYFQVFVGQEHLRLEGNVERFFPLFLAVFVVAEAVLVLAWRALPRDRRPPPDRLRRTVGVVLLLLAVFLTFGLHLRTMALALSAPLALTEHASSPTPFWLVKMMDLGIIVPAAVAVGWGLLRGAGWAVRAVYPLLAGYTCLAASVVAMAAVMMAEGDPDASWWLLAGFGSFAAVLAWLTVRCLQHAGREVR